MRGKMVGSASSSNESLYLLDGSQRQREKAAEILGRVKRQDWAVSRSQLYLNPAKALTGYTKVRYMRHRIWKNLKLKLHDAALHMEPWGNSFKQIEGHFGLAVMSYFKFLRWMLLLNVLILTLTFLFIIIPQIVYDYHQDARVHGGRNSSDICVSRYLHNKETENENVAQLMLDMVDGNGWMETTLMFYGHYGSSSLSLSYVLGGDKGWQYNIPRAYILVTITYFIVSLMLMCLHTSVTLHDQLRYSHQLSNSKGYISLAFSGWDFMLTQSASATSRHKLIYNNIMGFLEEQKHTVKKRGRSILVKVGLFFLRCLIHLLVVIVLSVSAWLIFLATKASTQYSYTDNEGGSSFLSLIYGFLPSFTITLLNFIIPVFFTLLVMLEDHSPEYEIRITLIRTVFLRLSSLCVLYATLYREVTCKNKDQCGVGVAECPEIECWETYVGQNQYRLVVTTVAVQFGSVFLMDFPRKLIVRHSENAIIKKIGYPTFNVAKHVLDVIYIQAIVWTGTFFMPMMPAIAVLLFLLMFYLKKLTLLCNHVPEERPYRSSRSHLFFMVVLIITFLLCCVPIGFSIYRLAPSRSCGPFREFPAQWMVISDMVSGWPRIIRDICGFVTSAGFILPMFVILCLLVYIFHTASSARKQLLLELHKQVSMASKEKQFLLGRLNDYERNK